MVTEGILYRANKVTDQQRVSRDFFRVEFPHLPGFPKQASIYFEI